MKIFDSEDYKVWLLRSLRDSTHIGGGRQSALANAMGCKPAYLSKVLNSKNHLSFEQASQVARFFKLSEIEKNYLIAAIGEKRALSSDLKAFWKKKMYESHTEYLNLQNRTLLEQTLTEKQMMVYYSNWYYSATHVAVSIPELQTVETISRYLQVSRPQIRECLNFLVSVGLVKKEGLRFITGKAQLHLDKNSPLIQNYHLSWKHKTIEAMQNKKKSDLNYLSIVSLSRKDLLVLKETLLSAIENIRKTVVKSKEEIIVCYALDMFELDRLYNKDEESE